EKDLTLNTSLAYRNHLSLVAPPEILVSKWIPDSDREYIDDTTWDLEWNDKIDTDAIQVSGFGTKEYIISQHVAAIYIICPRGFAWDSDENLQALQKCAGVCGGYSPIKRRGTIVVGVQHKELAKNVFIYWEGNSPPYLVLAGKVLEIDVKPGSTSLQIPCYISNPTASVNLFKEIGGQPVI
ncbi:hypothetical protein Ocin01_20196, partial [Orchesella cincta]